MDCLLVFDNLNDLIFSKYNPAFGNYITDFAKCQGLLSEDQPQRVNSNVLIQIFSPIVTSHRIMHCQFGNSYTKIQFHDDLNLTFTEFMGYLFMVISNSYVNNYVQMCVTFARYLCGPDIYQLHVQKPKSAMLTQLIDQWLLHKENDQAIFIEAVEQLIVNNDITYSCLQSLKDSITELTVHPEFSKVHALLLVENKFLSLYSSTNAKQLSPADILFTTILTHCKPEEVDKTSWSYQIFLTGSEEDPKCLPHSVHVVKMFERVFLVYLVEIGNPAVSATLYETFHHLHTLHFVQIQRDKQTIRLAFENLELAVKRLNDSLKKAKMSLLDNAQRRLMKKWDVIRNKYKEYLKTNSDEAILRAETLAINFLADLKELLNLISVDKSVLETCYQHVAKVVPKVKSDLAVFTDFFQVKGIKNFSLGSYLEQFPGLVHFLFVDRNIHRLTSPSLDMEAEDAEFIKKKIWSMISFSRSHLQEGNMSIIWKDNMFTYGYFLWFEDSSGEPLTTTIKPNVSDKIPGILGDDYYIKLKKIYFPKMSSSKIKCYELFCMYLGLTTPSGILEQTRRLAATVWELKGFPTRVIDLL